MSSENDFRAEIAESEDNDDDADNKREAVDTNEEIDKQHPTL